MVDVYGKCREMYVPYMDGMGCMGLKVFVLCFLLKFFQLQLGLFRWDDLLQTVVSIGL